MCAKDYYELVDRVKAVKSVCKAVKSVCDDITGGTFCNMVGSTCWVGVCGSRGPS